MRQNSYYCGFCRALALLPPIQPYAAAPGSDTYQEPILSSLGVYGPSDKP